MNLAHKSFKLFIAGASGSGKSTYATSFVLNSAYRFKFIFDPENEFHQRTGCAVATSGDAMLDQVESGWVIYDPEPMFGSDTAAGFAFFCDWVFAVCDRLPGTKLAFFDEMQDYVDGTKWPVPLRDIMRRGRRRSLDCCIVSQQPNAIHNGIRQQSTEIVAFTQGDENATKWLGTFGFPEKELLELPPGSWILLNRPRRVWKRGKVF